MKFGSFALQLTDRFTNTRRSHRWRTQPLKGSGIAAESVAKDLESSPSLLKLRNPKQPVMSYWSLVLPLTLLSAYLLLSTPKAALRNEGLLAERL